MLRFLQVFNANCANGGYIFVCIKGEVSLSSYSDFIMSDEEQQSQDLLADPYPESPPASQMDSVPRSRTQRIGHLTFGDKFASTPEVKRSRVRPLSPASEADTPPGRNRKKAAIRTYLAEQEEDELAEMGVDVLPTDDEDEEKPKMKKNLANSSPKKMKLKDGSKVSQPLKKRTLFEDQAQAITEEDEMEEEAEEEEDGGGEKKKKKEKVRKPLLEPKVYPLDSRGIYSLKVETQQYKGPFSAVVLSRKREGEEKPFEMHLRRSNVNKIYEILSKMMEKFRQPASYVAETLYNGDKIRMYEVPYMDFDVDGQLHIRTEVFKQARFSPLLVFEKRIPGKTLLPYKVPIEYIAPIFNALGAILENNPDV